MTTQSPDQSLSQSIRDIEQKHTKCRGVHVTTHYKAAFMELADLVTNLAKEVEGSLGAIERCHQCEGDGCAVCAELQSIPPLNAPLTQSPAPSKDIPQPEVTYRVYMRRKGDARWYSQESSDYEGDVRYWARLNNERNDGREYIAVKETRTFELL